MLQSGFVHATASKVLTFASLASVMLFDGTTQDQLGLSVQHVGDPSQLWRLVTSQLFFSRPDAAFCAAIGFYNMRQVERQMGTSKFVAFAAFVSGVSALLQLVVLSVFPKTFAGEEGAISSGPFALLFALYLVYWRWIPRRRRVVSTKLFGVVPITEKIMTYLFVSQCFLAGGLPSLVPSLSAIPAAAVYMAGVRACVRA